MGCTPDVLTVAVEVHDEIGARGERGVHARPERGDEAPRARVPLHVVGPRRPRDAAVPSMEPSSTTITSTCRLWDPAWDGRHDRADAVGLVQRGNDDRELEACADVRPATDVSVGRHDR